MRYYRTIFISYCFYGYNYRRWGLTRATDLSRSPAVRRGRVDIPLSRISSHENVFGKASRGDEEVGADRRQRSGGRPARLTGRDAPSRQTPPDLYALVDCGDHVIIINAAHVVLTGRKRDNKVYYNHTGFIGGIKERTAKSILEGRFPERVVEKAVERMIPRGP